MIEIKDFWVECNVCKNHLKNWVGSTPCCGSIAFVVEEEFDDKFLLLTEKIKKPIYIMYNGNMVFLSKFGREHEVKKRTFSFSG